MIHPLIQKYEALWNLSDAFRSMHYQKVSERKMTHPTFITRDVYGVAYIHGEMIMYCYGHTVLNNNDRYIRIPLREFSTEDQNYHNEIHHSYIAIQKIMAELQTTLKTKFIGTTVIRMAKDDRPEEECIIKDIVFGLELCIQIGTKTLDHVVPHKEFKFKTQD